MLFVEAPRTRDDLARIAAALGSDGAADGQHGRGRQDADAAGRRAGSARLLAGDLPRRHRARARQHGDRVSTRSLAAHGTNEPFRNRMLDFDELNALIGTPEMIALGKRYAAPPSRSRADE